MVERIVPHDLVLGSVCDSICSLHDSVRKLSAEGCCYVVFVGVGTGGEGEWLVGKVLVSFRTVWHGTPQPSGPLVVREPI